MKASVVICTYKRPEVTRTLLMELERQNYKDFEVLVICQGSKEDLEKIKYSIKPPYPVRFYYEEYPNLPHARNVGIENASGEIIIFLDDDARPSNTFIEAHVENYDDLSMGIVGGRIIKDTYEENVPDSKIGTIRRFDGLAHAGFHKDVRREVMHVRGVNMSVRKAVAKSIGGFDERFGGTAEFEEMDFCLRVLKKGFRIVFEPKAVVEHHRLSFGGCRAITKEESIYWMYFNHSLMFLKNLNKFFYPILIAEYIIRIIRRSLYWDNYKIIRAGVKGIRDGWRAYRCRI